MNDNFRKHKLQKAGIKDIPLSLRVRVLQFNEADGSPNCFLTSLAQDELDRNDVKGLYAERWTEEVPFNFDKNRMEVENFSAKMLEGIRQEWHAAILFANMTQLILEDAQKKLDETQADKPGNKYRYKINRSVACGLVKDELPKMLFGKEIPANFYARMIRLVLRHKEPIRPGRSFPKEKKHRLKYSMNLRAVV